MFLTTTKHTTIKNIKKMFLNIYKKTFLKTFLTSMVYVVQHVYKSQNRI